MSAQFGTATEYRAIAGRNIADVFARPSHPVRGRNDGRIVMGCDGCGNGREVWRVSVDDEVASWGEVGRLGFEALEFHGCKGRKEVWPRMKLVSAMLSLE